MQGCAVRTYVPCSASALTADIGMSGEGFRQHRVDGDGRRALAGSESSTKNASGHFPEALNRIVSVTRLSWH
jgi:hypothetical protein